MKRMEFTAEQIEEAAYALIAAYGYTQSGPDDGVPAVAPGLTWRELAKIALSATEGTDDG
jgi:hypothetical protein